MGWSSNRGSVRLRNVYSLLCLTGYFPLYINFQLRKQVRELAPQHVDSTLKRLEEAIGRDGLTDGQLIQKCLALEDERI
jgi:hypothetical protein